MLLAKHLTQIQFLPNLIGRHSIMTSPDAQSLKAMEAANELSDPDEKKPEAERAEIVSQLLNYTHRPTLTPNFRNESCSAVSTLD